jgi:hypothetical protein
MILGTTGGAEDHDGAGGHGQDAFNEGGPPIQAA